MANGAIAPPLLTPVRSLTNKQNKASAQQKRGIEKLSVKKNI